MPSKQASWTDPLVALGQTGFGIVLAVAPVALWVAWSPFTILVVVATIGASAVMFVLLHGCRNSADENQPAEPRNSSIAFLSDGFIEELHGIFPLVHHHSPHPRARFRRAMEKLRHLTD